mmetsp:Transcript_6417/g.14486  ORF Transcript_6417/g.14486 Transcript_6417/m.14486 type:complete len:227 (+) Transcript_6417:126-806(+)
MSSWVGRPFHLVLVGKVGCHTILCHLMHVGSTYLHLYRLSLVHERGVKRLVPIRLGEGDVILNLRWHGLEPGQMLHQSQNVIAKPYSAVCLLIFLVGRFQNNPQCDQVGNVIQIPIMLHLHLVPQGIHLLRPPHHLNLHILTLQRGIVLERLFQNFNGVVQRLAKLSLALSQPLIQLIVLVRIQVHERRILQLGLERPQSHAMRQRCEYIQRLATNLLLLLRLHVP